MTRLLNSVEVWFALGLLALNLSFAVEHYAPPGDTRQFVQGLLIGLSIAANILAIVLLPAHLNRRNK